MARPVTVAVSGPGAEVAGQLLELASEVGSLLARDGIQVLTGGLGGVMAAAARGARGAGGHAIGLLPGNDPEAGDEQHSLVLATGFGQARNALLVNAADGLIAVGGSWGTLSEIALGMRAGKPVVCLRGWHIMDAEGREVPLLFADTAWRAVSVLRQSLNWPAQH